jgi:hypothetical protein
MRTPSSSVRLVAGRQRQVACATRVWSFFKNTVAVKFNRAFSLTLALSRWEREQRAASRARLSGGARAPRSQKFQGVVAVPSPSGRGLGRGRTATTFFKLL